MFFSNSLDQVAAKRLMDLLDRPACHRQFLGVTLPDQPLEGNMNPVRSSEKSRGLVFHHEAYRLKGACSLRLNDVRCRKDQLDNIVLN